MAEEKIRIGTIFPLSGNLALNGQDTFAGAQIAQEIINEQGGINGKQIEFIIADAPDANAAVQEADRLITQEGVDIIIGTQSSSLSYAASAVAERKQKVYWEVEGVADSITNRGYKYLFRVTFSARQMSEQMLEFIKNVATEKLGKDEKDLRVALIYEDGEFGTSTTNNLKDLLKDYEFDFIMEAGYSAKSAELDSLVLKIKNNNPDVLLSISTINDSILLANTLKRHNFKPPIIIGTTAGHGTPDFVKGVGKEEADGILAAGIPNAINVEKMKPEIKELYDELSKKYKAKKDKEISVNVLNGFNGTWVLLKHVLPQVEEINPENIREAALNVSIEEGNTILGYGVKFAGPDASNAGHNIRAFAAVMQWQNGKLYIVYPDAIALKSAK